MLNFLVPFTVNFAVKHVQYDTSQGEHVEEKEASRHSVEKTSFEDEHAAHRRQEEDHASEGGRTGGVAT